MSEHKAGILVVDDEKEMIDILVSLLGDEYSVFIARNGTRALERAQLEPLPDLILLDILMPGMNGYDVCRGLKANPVTKNIPVIFLSGMGKTDDKTKGFESGSVDYITKPFNREEVLARVRTHMQIWELHRKLEKENARFKALEEAAFEGIIIHKNSKILNANAEAHRILGSEPDGLPGQRLSDYIPARCCAINGAEEYSQWEGEIAFRGKPVPVRVRTKKMSVTRHSVSITAIRDITVEKRLQDENRILKDTMKASYKFGDMIGRSPAMQSVYELITKAASSDFHTVIYGESGTGKEVAARTIWQLGSRRNGPFVAVNCGAVSETLFEREFFGHRKGSFTHADRDQPGFFDAAHRGTLFLDELGELMPAMQVKLLRVLESGEYIPVGDTKAKKADVRIISATNRNLPDLVARGKFREDLFYRIHVIEIIIPPLRERKEDIPLLADHFLSRVPDSGERPRVPGKILDALCRYEWPGNVRELENTLQRFVATNQLTLSGTRIMSADTEDLNPEQGLKYAIETVERRMIRETLQKTGWHRGKASKLLKIPRRTLHRKMAKYGFEK